MTSPQTSRRGAFVAPALLFVALLGGAMFFGLLAMSGKYEKDVPADSAAVAGTPSKAVPAARTISTTGPARAPRATADPPESHIPQRSATPPSPPSAVDASEHARLMAALPRKPVPGRTAYPIVGAYCTPAGAMARTADGAVVVCDGLARRDSQGKGAVDDKNRWQDADHN
ncbi:hypothetical protein ACFQS1_28250 [Paractinoplanes rhizophilus]|uniref:Uncharacterized protein n=1 Tax=Paractinoplanes rhizophilus TaxID=1416877 RepID=A0ABW2HYQ7_9ACTN|nr:hypothetical protein [Actinoplanes sp.]